MLSGFFQFCGSIGGGASPPPNRSADGAARPAAMAAAAASGRTATATRARLADAALCLRCSRTTTANRNVASLCMAPSRSAALPLRGIVRLLSRKCVVVALPIFGAFVLGLGTRRWLQRYFAVLFRAQFALGMGLLAALSGWSFDVTLRNVAAVGVLLVAQVSAVVVAARLFRDRTDGPLIAFGMYGNPTFWSLPVAAVTLGAEAGVFIVAYDMLTQPRIALGVKLLRTRAPWSSRGAARSPTTRRPPPPSPACCSACSSTPRRRSHRRHGARHRDVARRRAAARRGVAARVDRPLVGEALAARPRAPSDLRPGGARPWPRCSAWTCRAPRGSSPSARCRSRSSPSRAVRLLDPHGGHRPRAERRAGAGAAALARSRSAADVRGRRRTGRAGAARRGLGP